MAWYLVKPRDNITFLCLEACALGM